MGNKAHSNKSHFLFVISIRLATFSLFVTFIGVLYAKE
jgi:hypothetical protein